jgi:hypothetical protein
MHRTLLKKLIYGLKVGTPRAKWLKEFKLKKKLKTPTQFTKRNIKKCYKTVAEQFFLKNYPIIIT